MIEKRKYVVKFSARQGLTVNVIVKCGGIVHADDTCQKS